MEAGERARRDANLKKKRSVTSFPLFSILSFFFPARMMCSTAAAAADARFTDTHCAMSSLSTQQNCQSLEASLPHHHFIPSSSAAVAIFTLCRPLLLPALLIEGTTALPLCFFPLPMPWRRTRQFRRLSSFFQSLSPSPSVAWHEGRPHGGGGRGSVHLTLDQLLASQPGNEATGRQAIQARTRSSSRLSRSPQSATAAIENRTEFGFPQLWPGLR